MLVLTLAGFSYSVLYILKMYLKKIPGGESISKIVLDAFVMGSYFHKRFLLILSPTLNFGFFIYLGNLLKFLTKIAQILQKGVAKVKCYGKKSWIIKTNVNDFPFQISSR